MEVEGAKGNMLCAWRWMGLGQRALCMEVEGAKGNMFCVGRWRARASSSVRGGGGGQGPHALRGVGVGAWRGLGQRALCVEVEGSRATSSVCVCVVGGWGGGLGQRALCVEVEGSRTTSSVREGGGV